MLFEKIWNATRTLRFRLVVINALVVLLVSTGTLFGLRAGMRIALLHELDQILAGDLNELELALAEFDMANSSKLLEQLERKARSHVQYGWFVRMRPVLKNRQEERHSDRIRAQASDPGLADAWQDVNTPPALMNGLFDLRQPTTLAGYRVHTGVSKSRDGEPVTTWVGASLALIDRDLELIDRSLGLALILGLIIAPLGGFFLAGLATRPIASIIRTADRLRPEKMNERLPVRGTGDELDHLALSFNRLLDRIAAFLERNSDFLANAAHELRTPLAALRSTAEVALRAERSVFEYQELLSTIMEEGATLELLVNQLLLLAETEAAGDALEARGELVDLEKLSEKSCEMFAGVAESRSIELFFEATSQVIVRGNRHLLRQVLNNLIDNALKFTPDGGHIAVRLEAEALLGLARLTVSDTGAGISVADQARVFERFFRSERSHRRDVSSRGSGLGLSICDAVVKAHGGKIEVTSEPGLGSQFLVTIPLYHPSRRSDYSLLGKTTNDGRILLPKT